MSHDDDDYRPRRRRDDDDFDDRDRGGRRRDDDDDDYGRGRGDRGDSRDRNARGKLSIPATILQILGGILLLFTVYSIVSYAMNPEKQTKQTYDQYTQFIEAFTKAQKENQQAQQPPAPNNGKLPEKKEPNPPKEKEEEKKGNEAANNPPAANLTVMPYEDFKQMYQNSFVGGVILQMAYGLLLIFGGMKMKQLRGYGWGVAASIVSILPCISCCCLPTPIGLWALIVLMNQDVKSAFR